MCGNVLQLTTHGIASGYGVDNGNDYMSYGRYRIVDKNDKIGYATVICTTNVLLLWCIEEYIATNLALSQKYRKFATELLRKSYAVS